MKKHAVFLDRDGVLNGVTVRNGTPHPPATVDEVRVLPGVADALARLRGHDFILIGVTNQPDVARGATTREAVDAINNALLARLPLQEMFVCWHDNHHQCECRKPKPGMLLAAAAKYDVDLAGSFMVGDRSSDVIAGQAAGCRSILIHMPYSKAGQCRPDHHARDLMDAALWILAACGLSHSPQQ